MGRMSEARQGASAPNEPRPATAQAPISPDGPPAPVPPQPVPPPTPEVPPVPIEEPPTPGAPPVGDPPVAPPVSQARPAKEIGGPTGPEPTRYGDWERKGRVSDF